MVYFVMLYISFFPQKVLSEGHLSPAKTKNINNWREKIWGVFLLVGDWWENINYYVFFQNMYKL